MKKILITLMISAIVWLSIGFSPSGSVAIGDTGYTEQTRHYSNLSERDSICKEYEELNKTTGSVWRMVSDNFDADWKRGDEPHGTLTFTNVPEAPPASTEPSRSTHISTLEAIDPTKARPAKVKRVWEGREYFYDCLVTQTVKDEYIAGIIKIGDYVLVHFDDIGEQIVIAKVFKSWR